MCQTITSGLLLYSSWRRSCHFLAPAAYSCPDTSFCCQLSFAKMLIMPFCKLDPWITLQKKEVLGGIISWDHLADPGVSLLSGGCISTAEGVTNCALQRNGWEGSGGKGSIATQKSTHSLPKGGQQACTLIHYLVLWPNLWQWQEHYYNVVPQSCRFWYHLQRTCCFSLRRRLQSFHQLLPPSHY